MWPAHNIHIRPAHSMFTHKNTILMCTGVNMRPDLLDWLLLSAYNGALLVGSCMLDVRLLCHDTAGIETEGAQTFTESSVRYRERTREEEENSEAKELSEQYLISIISGSINLQDRKWIIHTRMPIIQWKLLTPVIGLLFPVYTTPCTYPINGYHITSCVARQHLYPGNS